jgi:hypothetical protein
MLPGGKLQYAPNPHLIRRGADHRGGAEETESLQFRMDIYSVGNALIEVYEVP